jgi:AraC family transcriptional regulator
MRGLERLVFSLPHTYGLAVYPPGATFGPRRLADYEFVWIIDGDVVFEADGVPHPAPAGTVILSRPGMRDAYTWDPKRTTRHGFFHFSIERNGADLPPDHEWPLTRRMGENDVLRSLFHHLDWLLSARPAEWEPLAQSALRHLLGAFLSGSTATAGEHEASLHPTIERAMAYVQRTWASGTLRPIALGELAGRSGVSRAHLTRLFRAEYDMTPIEALRWLRLDRAASLLSRTNLKINDIAERCGFGSAFHFSRLFHTAYGHSPRAFRQRLADGMDAPTTILAHVRKLSERVFLRR